ncbi:GDSL-type esterase/lipase family protein [Flagellimonas sp. CMM7]|uniref:GDSL-type esterase/lipase family protein n=1 Tax=Flagellimonas sp. CMM7 TaxID=2654676 RepID=UPI0013D5448C|nr:GDSL-type esterase/lipase family protein [Flagellimonas sp. CMM7]UII78899.1 GDSL-type esterase/lipase family protein [Flagellimonas sp. CMM7]
MIRYLLLLFLSVLTINAQESLPFANEVKEVQQKTDSIWDASKNTIVFTGSSSIRLWKDLQKRFPEHQILNTGFGGSQSSDLEHYLNELILNYTPTKVFIYEGDNDISAKRKPKAIIGTIERILKDLHQKRPEMEIVLISAKPSISRWHLKGRYKRLNKQLSKLASNSDGVQFADVWNIMLNKRKLKTDLFIADGLHMNVKGYDLWYEVIKNYMNKTNP